MNAAPAGYPMMTNTAAAGPPANYPTMQPAAQMQQSMFQQQQQQQPEDMYSIKQQAFAQSSMMYRGGGGGPGIPGPNNNNMPPSAMPNMMSHQQNFAQMQMRTAPNNPQASVNSQFPGQPMPNSNPMMVAQAKQQQQSFQMQSQNAQFMQQMGNPGMTDPTGRPMDPSMFNRVNTGNPGYPNASMANGQMGQQPSMMTPNTSFQNSGPAPNVVIQNSMPGNPQIPPGVNAQMQQATMQQRQMMMQQQQQQQQKAMAMQYQYQQQHRAQMQSDPASIQVKSPGMMSEAAMMHHQQQQQMAAAQQRQKMSTPPAMYPQSGNPMGGPSMAHQMSYEQNFVQQQQQQQMIAMRQQQQRMQMQAAAAQFRKGVSPPVFPGDYPTSPMAIPVSATSFTKRQSTTPPAARTTPSPVSRTSAGAAAASALKRRSSSSSSFDSAHHETTTNSLTNHQTDSGGSNIEPCKMSRLTPNAAAATATGAERSRSASGNDNPHFSAGAPPRVCVRQESTCSNDQSPDSGISDTSCCETTTTRGRTHSAGSRGDAPTNDELENLIRELGIEKLDHLPELEIVENDSVFSSPPITSSFSANTRELVASKQ